MVYSQMCQWMLCSQMSLWMLYAHMSENRSHDHVTSVATCVVKITMATKVRIQFNRFILQILLEYNPPVSKKSVLKLILWIYIPTMMSTRL